MLMELLLDEAVTVVIGTTPDDSDALSFKSKNHSNVGEGSSEGRGIGSTRVAVHISE